MKLPIEAYGNTVLRQKCVSISKCTPELLKLIDDMWETMNVANGCGLAAPQVGQTLNLFVVDTQTTFKMLAPGDRKGFFEEGDKGIKETFINAKIIESGSEYWDDYEGCLSLPGLNKKVCRPWTISIEYLDVDFNKQVKSFGGYTARAIQHEYDHTNGILFIDHLDGLSRKLSENKLRRIKKGQVATSYRLNYMY